MEELLKELEETKQKIAEIGKKIEDIENKIAKKKVETGRWKPEEGDTYWFINDIGDICKSTWDNVNIDRKRYLIGNCYQTKEECEFAIEKLKVIAELKEYEEPKNRVWNYETYHYHFYYSYKENTVKISENWKTKRNDIYFESGEKARQALEEVGEGRIKKYYLEVEE
jgi:hypothetical protein